VSAAGAPWRARPVEAVIFDYGGVISVRFLGDLGRFEAAQGYPPGSVTALMFGGPTDGTSVHDFHLLEMGRLPLPDYLTGLTRRAPDVLGRPLDYDAYLRFMSASAVAVHWPVVHRIQALRDDGVALALLTNNVREFGDTWRATFPVDELFPIVVDSSEVGMRKPDAAIYEHTCARLGVAPDAAVFLDDVEENVLAAADVGLDTVHFGTDPLASLADLDAILDRRGVRTR
jgi:putative hydrolase of the HAD superfamily